MAVQLRTRNEPTGNRSSSAKVGKIRTVASEGPTAQQLAVIEAPASSRLLVSAGPGTGKTEVLARRLVHFLGAGVKPSRILVLSFSRSAVRTLTKRIERFVSRDSEELLELRHLAVRTFDSWSFRMLRLLDYVPAELLRNGYDANIAMLVAEMRGDGRARMHELLGHCEHVLVDEFQDLSGARGALVLELLDIVAPKGPPGAGFTLLGDEAQAIYGFSLPEDGEDGFGAVTAKKLFRDLKKHYGNELEQIELTTNFRAKPNLANAVESMRRILARPISGAKKLDAMRKLVSRAPELDSSKLDLGTLCGPTMSAGLLCRTNGQALRLAELLMGRGDDAPVPLVEVTAGSPPRSLPAWVGATLGRFRGATLTRSHFHKIYEHLYGDAGTLSESMSIPDEDNAWAMLLLAGDAGAGTNALDLSKLRTRLGWTDFLPDDEGVADRAIEVLTIHQSKGMEYDRVLLLESSAADPPNGKRNGQTVGDEQLEEEAHVLFVALSRAGRELSLISEEGIYPLSNRQFNGGARSRWYSWKNKWVNLEIGIYGDVAPTGFASTELHESDSQVDELQVFLARSSDRLRGHKVVLCKTSIPGHVNHYRYNIHLQENEKPGRLLGMTNPQLTFDLLKILQNPGKWTYGLPGRIFNLRIRDTVTCAMQEDPPQSVAEPWRKSGLWVGLTIHGLGAFKT